MTTTDNAQRFSEKLEAAADKILAEFSARDDADQAARVADAELRALLERVLPFLTTTHLVKKALRSALVEADRAAILAEHLRSEMRGDVPA